MGVGCRGSQLQLPVPHFIKNGNQYSVAPSGALVIETKLPAQTYVVKLNPMTGFYLEIVEDFSLPPKIYGDTLIKTQRVLNTFNSRPHSTGVLLVGDKGSGKTLLAKNISKEAVHMGIPTLVINSSFTGDQFNSFIQSIHQPAIIIFDEFEKTYDSKGQEAILTLLDGVFPSKKLFILTSNDKYKIDDNMKNRPGRIYYMFTFKGLGEEFIREYCEDNLNDKSKIDDLVKVSSMFDSFNFDLLCAFVEEVNRYGESPLDLTDLLNARPEYCGGSNYEITRMAWGDIEIDIDSLRDSTRHVYDHRPSIDSHGFVIDFNSEDDKEIKQIKALPIGERTEAIYHKFKKGLLTTGDMHSSVKDVKDMKKWYQVGIDLDPEFIREYTLKGVVYITDDGILVEISKSTSSSKKSKKRGGLAALLSNKPYNDDAWPLPELEITHDPEDYNLGQD